MTRALLLRHGQSEWNASGRWQGQADPPLTELGRHQALHASRSIGAVDAIFASDLDRALTTAMIISEQHGVGPVVVDPDLRERHAGEWQGLTRAEIERDWPGYLGPPPPVEGQGHEVPTTATPASELGAAQRRPPGWESDEALLERARAALARVHEAVPDGDVLVVTHGGLIYAIERALGAEFVRLPNLGGRYVELGPDGPVALGERVVLVDPDELTVPTQI
ncbi:MAG TPA: histidine phosphatase family protein [Acidimicrobiales bacterium]|nr:histidine phosphatase family protein [Acidimicrobiales bacterium]